MRASWAIAIVFVTAISGIQAVSVRADEDRTMPSPSPALVAVPPGGPESITLMTSPAPLAIRLYTPPTSDTGTPATPPVPATDAADLYSTGVSARQVVGPVAVQGPAVGGGFYGAYGLENPTGPLNVTAWLASSVCRGGPTDVETNVYDQNGNGVAGAAVVGYVQFSISGSNLTFPNTDKDGDSHLMFNMGSTRGGYTVQFSIHAEDGKGNSADTAIGCYAP